MIYVIASEQDLHVKQFFKVSEHFVVCGFCLIMK